MTAEIAIMNKNGIALASDSAVTVSTSTGNKKIYDSVNKLFTLSKYKPVGIMVYGGASFMDVPWETIIKDFRDKLGDTEHDKLISYADDFIEHLKDNHLISTKKQKSKYLSYVYRLFVDINKEIKNQFNEDISENINDMKSINESLINDLIRKNVSQVINKKHNEMISEDFNENFDESDIIKSHGKCLGNSFI